MVKILIIVPPFHQHPINSPFFKQRERETLEMRTNIPDPASEIRSVSIRRFHGQIRWMRLGAVKMGSYSRVSLRSTVCAALTYTALLFFYRIVFLYLVCAVMLVGFSLLHTAEV